MQVIVCGGLLTGVGMAFGLPKPVAFVAGMGFVLTSTAVVLQILDERGETSTPAGQRVVSILLLEDLAIVPLFAVVAVLGASGKGGETFHWQSLALAAGSVAALVAAGYWLLNPLFRLLASVQAREVMTAAALLVVLGAALVMQLGGLSMAMGAFLAGVLLSGIRASVISSRPISSLSAASFSASSSSASACRSISRWWRENWLADPVACRRVYGGQGHWHLSRGAAVRRHRTGKASLVRAMMAQGGEFAFVLYSAAAGAGILEADTHAVLTAAVILSMVLTPLLIIAHQRLMPPDAPSMDGVEIADGLRGTVLIVGFGRVGQVMSQLLLARGVDVSIIDTDVDMIRSAEDFGFKVYFGDGTRLDVLRTSGAGMRAP